MDIQPFLTLVKSATSLEELMQIKANVLGKKGILSQSLRALSSLSLEEKKRQGPLLNSIKEEILEAINEHSSYLEQKQWKEELAHEALDVTLPPPHMPQGRFHPLAQSLTYASSLLYRMGFSLRKGPDIETEFYNFDALNISAHHPSRTQGDTFYLPGNFLLRTQTSPVQIRTLQKEKPPLRIFSPGRVYRADHDKTHTPMFHQIEGLIIEEGFHMGHLKAYLEEFLKKFLREDITLRFRPSFFPFTFLSAEIDIRWGSEWLEVLGCGMVHPHVLSSCGLPESTIGGAFGMGIERLAMIKYGIEDIRLLYQNDQRWLNHFGFPCTYNAS